MAARILVIRMSGIDPELKPFRSNHGRYRIFILAKRTVVCRAQNVVDYDTVVGQRVESAPIQDADIVKPRATLDHEATAFGENLRQM
jgi:hypothetical protein